MTLYEQIASMPRLREGWKRTRSNNGMEGTDGVTVRMFELRLERELNALRGELLDHTYAPQPLLRFDIPKAGGKIRSLSVPSVRDRVAQSSALVVLGPIIERELETSSFAYRPGLSHRDAVRRLRGLRDDGYRWVVDADIESFFDRVDHDLLMQRFAELVADTDVQALVRQWITTEALYEGERLSRDEGLPQGAVISPLLANLYLDRFDEDILGEGFKLVRYADDFVVLCRSEPQAEQALDVTEQLLSTLELRINQDKTRITSFDEGFRFLGSLFVRSLVLPSANRSLKAVPSDASEPPPSPERTAPTENVSTEKQEPKELPGSRVSSIPVPGRDQLSRTSLGRAFLRALDAEGLSPGDFADALAASGSDEADLPAALALTEDEFPDPDEPIQLRPGAAPFMRTLYIQEQGTWLRMNQGRFVVTDGREPNDELLSVPAFKIDQILIFGSCLITPAALRFCLRRGIPVTLLSTRGQHYGKIEAMKGRDVSRQRRQFLCALDPAFRLDLSRRFVEAKLHNTRSLLRRYARRRDSETLHAAARSLSQLMRQLEGAETLDELRGYEGRGSAVYFEVLDELIQGSAFTFEGRTRRPPTDPVNAMLSFGYTLLFNNIYAFVRMHRLHPYVGFLHDERAGHPTLVSDLIEEFRFLIERMVLALCNRRRLAPEDFYREDADSTGASGGCFLADDARKTFIQAFEHAMYREVTHPVTETTTTYRRCLDLQVRSLSRHLDDVEPYVPFRIT
jgi:CRISPR-associated protein Cas1